MPVIVIPVPNLMIVKDQQGQRVGLVNETGNAVVSPTIGSTESAWEPIGITKQRDALGTYEVPSAFRNKLTGAVVPNPNLSRPRIQSITEAFPERFKKKPKERPRRAGGRNSGGGGGGAAAPVFAGGAGDRISQLQEFLTTGATPGGIPITRPSGQLTESAQAALVDGLDLSEFTPALVAWLDPSQSVEFLVYDDGLGSTSFIDGRMLTSESLAYLNSQSSAMNFPTAHQYAKIGYMIGLSSWVDADGAPNEWLRLENGVWYRGFGGEWAIVTSERGETDPNLTIDELKASNWTVEPLAPLNLPILDQI